MIKFFRRIRQRLLSQNKLSQYFLYAIGEIILVVIGILMALQINNWNTDRINTGKQQEYLAGLASDLEAQIASFNNLDQRYDFLIGNGESILKDFSSKGKFSAIDGINKKLSILMFTGRYPDISTTFHELNSTGQLQLIKKKQLRSHVIKYYQSSATYQLGVDGNTENVIYNQIFPVINSMVIIRPENFGFENNSINLSENLTTTFNNNLNNSNKEFDMANAISLRIIVAKTNKKHIEIVKKEAELLLDAINIELNRN